MQEILVLNSGSSSVKFALYHINNEDAAGGAEVVLTPAYTPAIFRAWQCRMSLAHCEPG